MKISRPDKKIAIKSNGEGLIEVLTQAGILNESKLILYEPGLSAYHMKDGTILEVYAPGKVHPDFLFEKGLVVASFRVPDLQGVVSQLVAAGVAIPDGIQEASASYNYCYAQFGSGLVVGFYQENEGQDS
jgi:hypothetical protein